MCNMAKTRYNMKLVEETLKKMCDLTGNSWSYKINRTTWTCEAILYTDISSPKDDNGTSYKTAFLYDCNAATDGGYHYSVSGIRFYEPGQDYWRRLCVRKRYIDWKVPVINLQDPSKAQEYVDLIRNLMNKKTVTYDKKYKEHIQEKRLLDVEFEDFIGKMNELAAKYQVDFLQDPVKLKCWYLKNKSIKIYQSEDLKNWLVNVYQYGFTKFVCQSLDEAYKVCEWFFSCPVQKIM